MRPWQQFRWIMKNTRISRDHLTPEISLRLITPECPIFMAQPEDCPFPDPYWGFYWPGGQGMSRFLLSNPEWVRGKRVLDFGCGCGASGIAALKSHCSSLTFCDIDITALGMAMMNSRLNRIDPRIVRFDSTNYLMNSNRNSLPTDSDIILLGDMFYDSDFAENILSFLKYVWKKKSEIKVLVGDPGRHGLESAKRRKMLKELAIFALPPNIAAQGWGFPTTSVSQLIYSES